MTSVATQRFLVARTPHTWALQFLANDPASLARWGGTCRVARAETSDENPLLWSYVWIRGLGKTRPLGPRQVRRAKAHVLRAMLKGAMMAGKGKPDGLSESHAKLILQLRREEPGLASPFDHIRIGVRTNPHNNVSYVFEQRPYRSTFIDFTRLKVISAERRLRRDRAALAAMSRHGGLPVGLLEAEARRLMGKKLKRCLLYTSPSPRDGLLSRMPSSA